MTLITHRVTGNPDGPPVFLLNGGLMSMAAWEKIAVALEDAYRVVRCDFRGQLFAPGGPEPRLEPHAEDLVALLDSLGIEKIHAAGTSFGALVALRLASLHPERVASVIAITATEKITPELWESSAAVLDGNAEGTVTAGAPPPWRSTAGRWPCFRRSGMRDCRRSSACSRGWT